MYGSIPKGKCGGAFYFVVFVQRKKERKKQKEGIKFLKEKKIEKKEKKMSEREMSKIELYSCIIFHKRLEENKKVVSGIA